MLYEDSIVNVKLGYNVGPLKESQHHFTLIYFIKYERSFFFFKFELHTSIWDRFTLWLLKIQK